MAVGVFPALKLGVLFIKQISKPLAKMLVTQAKNHAVFRTYFIIPPAQFYHWAEVKTKMYIMNLGKPTKVAKLNEQMAIELGASLMGEVIIFSVAGGCLILEYNRQVAKETKKEEARQAQIQKFTDDIDSLHVTANRQEEDIRVLQSAIDELIKHSRHKIPTLEQLRNEELKKKKSSEDTRLGEKGTNSEPDSSNEKEEQSLVRRAIVYFQNDVKGNNKLS
ncbi:putative OPA3-like protein CG13603 [Venturia canescens]|uniref:putative OPA3-like protein CG13603 n=1 Tax=Venturia canescens TaxID=32260 RepID=UPI001C9D1A32|nr:putative OPA3-like protein CG13603 [Venturia canescens]XP_043271678.1 putative OPA3-like protein CG13603 [Venturia canescens]